MTNKDNELAERDRLVNEYMAEQHTKVLELFKKLGVNYLGKGKTKMFGEKGDTIFMRFLDSYTGHGTYKEGGGNEIAGIEKGLGHMNLMVAWHWFELFEKAGIPTQNIDIDPENNLLVAHKGKVLGNGMPFTFEGEQHVSKGTEFLMRNYNMPGSSYAKRFPDEEVGKNLIDPKTGKCFAEASAKTDIAKVGDPVFEREFFVNSGYMTEKQYDAAIDYSQQATGIATDVMEKEGYLFGDTKFEYIEDAKGVVRMGDEISTGTSRVRRLADGVFGARLKDAEIYNAMMSGLRGNA